MIYGTSHYLDTMADNWDGLVLNDYEAVMPLTWRKKYGIRYLYQPAFVQQLGVFSSVTLNENVIHDFINAAQKFRFAEIPLNFDNHLSMGGLIKVHKNNYLLPLKSSYCELSDQYQPYLKERLHRLQKFVLQYENSPDYTEAITLYNTMYGDKMSFTVKDKNNFTKLCDTFSTTGQVIVRKVSTNHYDDLAVLLMLKDRNRLYNIMSYTSLEGRKMLANYFMYDEVIKEFAGQGLILDFEGSDVEGIAYFYSKFATINQQYPFVKWNNLPWLLKLLKR